MGLAGAAGVVATGVVIVRAERRRRAYTPDQVREQLHIRYVQATAAEQPPTVPASETPVGVRARIRQRLRRRKPQNPSV
ncbi:Uncharacterised protein [Nocardia otitidiscaviarum]|uniref:Uncharacterized protein n=1 Tax=Nocardia otitidiscaviarum TaxID=1823 RepID=A0A378YAJ8_9NOCA|nr:Uncharacterised protein [Nocardia otitidiscaviarum]